MSYRDDIKRILTKCNLRAYDADTKKVFQLLESGAVNDEFITKIHEDLQERWEVEMAVTMGREGWTFLQAQVVRFYELFKACPVFCPTPEDIPDDPYLIMLPKIDENNPSKSQIKKLLWKGYRIIHLLEA